ncbi:hypothetical protein EOL96_02660 [Candidatus Saccharibacteria bacterium]|nr:hypothetical protein [Candidatus Saccharibacteria bacterium]
MKSLRLARPHAIMMVGIPGSGKSFFASKFAETFGAPYIDSLVIEAHAKNTESAGALIAIMVGEVAKTSQTFVFEGNSDTRARRTEFARWARSKGYQPLFVWVQIDESTAKNRTLKSQSLTADGFAAVMQDFSPPHHDERPIVISGKHTYASQARVVLNHLSRDGKLETDTPARTAPPARPAGRSVIVR